MRICLRRREFIGGLGGAAAWPLAARAQRPGLPVVVVISSSTANASALSLAAFRKRLSETGNVSPAPEGPPAHLRLERRGGNRLARRAHRR
jgi:hypothetical protein